jgi:hypothetical protein
MLQPRWVSRDVQCVNMVVAMVDVCLCAEMVNVLVGERRMMAATNTVW